MPDTQASAPDFNEDTATGIVLARQAACADPRLRRIMDSVVRHLHAAVREVEPTPEEWIAAVRFLTEAGQACTPARQEFILLSDVLGVSMLVDAIAERRAAGCTESTVLGPFHVAGAPELPPGADIARAGGGEPMLVEGRVLDEAGAPVAGASLDVWQTSHDGFYDVQQPDLQPAMNLRGRFRTDGAGRFRFRTVKPSSYPIPTDGPVGRLLRSLGRHAHRPAHVHFIVEAAGFRPLTTHLFIDGDPYLGSDAVFGVKPGLVVGLDRVADADAAREAGFDGPFWRAAYDFRLPRAEGGASAAAVTWSAAAPLDGGARAGPERL